MRWSKKCWAAGAPSPSKLDASAHVAVMLAALESLP